MRPYSDLDCHICGAPLEASNKSVPCYEGYVLHNDWEGEWGGFQACRDCFAAQQALSEPVTFTELSRRSQWSRDECPEDDLRSWDMGSGFFRDF